MFTSESSEKTGKKRNQGDTDEGNPSSRDKLLNALRLCPRVIRSISFQKVDAAPYTERTAEGYNLVTLTRDSSSGASVLVCSSTEFAIEATLQGGGYGNASFLLSALTAMGKDEVPVSLKSQPFSDTTIHILTTAQARNITIALVAGPMLIVAVWGAIVLIRRKFA